MIISFALAVVLTLSFKNTCLAQSSDFFSIDSDPVTLTCLTNKARAENCVGPLGLDSVLNQVALGHSEDMSSMNNMTHFGSNNERVGWRIDQTSWNGNWVGAGENIAVRYIDPLTLVRAWLNSTDHRRNLLNSSYTQVGFGYDSNGNYWTEVLVEPRSPMAQQIPDCSGVVEMSTDVIDIPEIHNRFTSAEYCSSNATEANSASMAPASTSENSSSDTTADSSMNETQTQSAESSNIPADALTSDQNGSVYAWAFPVIQADGTYSYVYNSSISYNSVSAAVSGNPDVVSQIANKNITVVPLTSSTGSVTISNPFIQSQTGQSSAQIINAANPPDGSDQLTASSLSSTATTSNNDDAVVAASLSTPDPSKQYMIAYPEKQSDGSYVYYVNENSNPITGSQVLQYKSFNGSL